MRTQCKGRVNSKSVRFQTERKMKFVRVRPREQSSPIPALSGECAVWCSCMVSSSRPVFLKLTQIKMPVGALTSIGHRLSGLVLALGVPAALYLLALSLRSEEGFRRAYEAAHLVPAKLAGILLAWAMAHHLLAGIRHMLTDVAIGSTLAVARLTARLANWGALACAGVTTWLLW